MTDAEIGRAVLCFAAWGIVLAVAIGGRYG